MSCPTYGSRIVLGLLEGYDPSAPVHTIEEVKQALPEASVTPADVFAVRHSTEGVAVYTEPVAVVEATNDQIGDIYKLGELFRQERFTVEDFARGVAYMVETQFCTEPDM